MTNLTEQWKKGELPEGWYYVKVIPDFEYPNDIAFYTGGYFELYSDEDIEQVLSPLPSYQEYLESESHCAVYSEVNKSLKEENERLEAENAQLHKFLEGLNDLDVAKENEQLKLIIKRTKASGNYPSKVSQYKARITALTEENQQLKEMLKECRPYFDALVEKRLKLEYIPQVYKLLTKIDNAIGEN